jgi:hypothetical protein
MGTARALRRSTIMKVIQKYEFKLGNPINQLKNNIKVPDKKYI